jgi:N-acylneuraminate cytidylyltransferase
MRTLGLIPARGGSRGIPRKNIRPLHGKPLIAWTVEAASDCPDIDRLIVSTEDAEIAAVVRSLGCEVLPRPAALARDDTTSVEVALHVLRTIGESFDLLVLLQPTSPLRQTEDISACLRVCREGAAPACVSIVRATEPPFWMFTQTPSGCLEPIVPRHLVPLRRQDLPAAFLLNGAVYVAKTSWLETHKTFLGPGVHGYVMPTDRSIDIDSAEDWQTAEAWLAQRR